MRSTYQDNLMDSLIALRSRESVLRSVYAAVLSGLLLHHAVDSLDKFVHLTHVDNRAFVENHDDWSCACWVSPSEGDLSEVTLVST